MFTRLGVRSPAQAETFRPPSPELHLPPFYRLRSPAPRPTQPRRRPDLNICGIPTSPTRRLHPSILGAPLKPKLGRSLTRPGTSGATARRRRVRGLATVGWPGLKAQEPTLRPAGGRSPDWRVTERKEAMLYPGYCVELEHPQRTPTLRESSRGPRNDTTARTLIAIRHLFTTRWFHRGN